MVDLRWYLACEESGWSDDIRDKGWPACMELHLLAAFQFPPVSQHAVLDDTSSFDRQKWGPRTGTYDPARNQRAALYEAMLAACNAGQLPFLRKRSDLSPSGTQVRALRPEDFALWFHAQGGTPSQHILAWFESQQVDFPPKDAAAHQAMTGFAALLASREAKRKGQEWTDEEKQQLRAEFQRRGGWMPDGPGSKPRKSQQIRQELARELGMRADRGLDRHLGEAPEPSTAFPGVVHVLAGRR